MDIRCRKTGCVYNDKYTCKAKEILIEKDCCCQKFEEDLQKPKVDKTQYIFSDNPPKYAPQRDSLAIEIECKAHCLFNKDVKCVATGITLNDIKEKPLCITFLKK